MKFEVSGFCGKSILYCILSYACTCARIDYKEYDIDKRVLFISGTEQSKKETCDRSGVSQHFHLVL